MLSELNLDVQSRYEQTNSFLTPEAISFQLSADSGLRYKVSIRV